MQPPNSETSIPEYLNHPEIRLFLNWFLDKLKNKAASERTRRLTNKFPKTIFKTLHSPREPNDDLQIWALIEQCEKDGFIRLRLTKPKTDPDRIRSQPWLYYRAEFNSDDPDNENRLRRWLDRPLLSDKELEWQAAVARHRHRFANPDKLNRMIFDTLAKPAEEIISRMASIPELLSKRPMTAYQLSAILFWGCSKILKDREQWIKELFNLEEGLNLERPLLIEVRIPRALPNGLLMLENLDSYLAACDNRWSECDDLILVYTQGFRGAASRIRQNAYARFHQYRQDDVQTKLFHEFKAAWLNETPFTYPIYFIGDLDWSGLSIFRSLKSIFPELMPWRNGYIQLIEARKNGRCHTPEMAGKENQKPIDSTGDTWLDEHALEPMKKEPLFVDQEVIE